MNELANCKATTDELIFLAKICPTILKEMRESMKLIIQDMRSDHQMEIDHLMGQGKGE